MTDVLQALKEQLPDSEELLRAIGLQYERNAASTLTIIGAFAIGSIAGAALAILFAPRSGHEVRQELNERVRDWTQRMGWSERSNGEDERPATS